ncbi:MAG: putative manganese-dependent inorganic diphosphatase [Desulfuromonadaceae bacterium]|nr:putative manganese-dependent inorganic diphosphatase [Desulfuromonadaceae bacterium]MDD2848400.1 putative manganese-dependent inorganic diphosphatase [Desulfuromonadaceae bacterium]MDD4129971.1 putative manganese-dependent inorganic diphosphatase [Desulfuromonadaceae bacterium]
MTKTTYVIGHRNPDTDSIASAIGYAALKQRQGDCSVIAAMAGAPNPQTRYILDRLGIPDPLFLADVHPKVRDTLKRQPVTIDRKASAYVALELFNKSGVRVLPVVDDENRPCGILSLLHLSESYLLPCQDKLRQVTTSLLSLAKTLAGHLESGTGDDTPITLNLFIGAMLEESFSSMIDGYEPRELLIMTGNRRTIQLAAIERGVRVLVVTGGHRLEDGLLQLAKKQGVTVLLTPHDTATAAWLARLSTPVACLAEQEFSDIGVDKSLAALRQKLLGANVSAVLALEGDGTLAGVATKSSLLAPLPYSLILVDHNELGQAVPGAELVEIAEVIDHHKLGNSHSNSPISFITSPVGSTCTLVARRYRESGLEPDRQIATLLLAGILSDTVILKSPTTTDADHQMAAWLKDRSGVVAADFGRDIFAASSSLKNYGSADRIVAADFKLFTHEKYSIGLGQVEVIGFDEFYSMKEDLLSALADVKRRDNLFIAGLMVTDITTETTLFLVEGHTRIAHVMEYPQLEPHLYELKNVMSRKKQMVPHLLKILAKV